MRPASITTRLPAALRVLLTPHFVLLVSVPYDQRIELQTIFTCEWGLSAWANPESLVRTLPACPASNPPSSRNAATPCWRD
jgi:hypothetical protein